MNTGLDLTAFARIFQAMLHARYKLRSPLGSRLLNERQFLEKNGQELECTEQECRDTLARFRRMFQLSPAFNAPVPEAPLRACLDAFFREWQAGPRMVEFETSGSTGTPKRCRHSEAALWQELDGLLPYLAGARRILLCVPPYHLFGFTFGVVLPTRLGIPVVPVPMLSTVVAATMRPGDLVAGIPLLWNQFLRGATPAGNKITVLSATAPLSAETFHSLRELHFSVLEIFGSSETGVLGFRRNETHPFTLAPQFSFCAEGQEGGLVRTLPDGTRQPCDLQDRIDWVGRGAFYAKGRVDNAVIVAGVNVYPGHIASQLAKIPGVRECAVRLATTNGTGRLKAFLVPAPEADKTLVLNAVRQYARTKLTDVERPVSFTFGNVLPRNSMGKLADWQCEENLCHQ